MADKNFTESLVDDVTTNPDDAKNADPVPPQTTDAETTDKVPDKPER